MAGAIRLLPVSNTGCYREVECSVNCANMLTCPAEFHKDEIF